MPRSKRKGPYVVPKLLKKILNTKPGESFKLRNRAMQITPKLIGKTVLVHTGKDYVPVYITIEMVGRKFGEFAETRAQTKHAGDRKTK